MNIHIITIPRDQMRPEVDGADWQFNPNGDLTVKVCPMKDWRYEALLGIHEAVEALMCKADGISQEQVDRFDQRYDQEHENDIEAGDDFHAPYRDQHNAATGIERTLSAHLGVVWSLYDQELINTYPGPKHREK